MSQPFLIDSSGSFVVDDAGRFVTHTPSDPCVCCEPGGGCESVYLLRRCIYPSAIDDCDNSQSQDVYACEDAVREGTTDPIQPGDIVGVDGLCYEVTPTLVPFDSLTPAQLAELVYEAGDEVPIRDDCNDPRCVLTGLWALGVPCGPSQYDGPPRYFCIEFLPRCVVLRFGSFCFKFDPSSGVPTLDLPVDAILHAYDPTADDRGSCCCCQEGDAQQGIDGCSTVTIGECGGVNPKLCCCGSTDQDAAWSGTTMTVTAEAETTNTFDMARLRIETFGPCAFSWNGSQFCGTCLLRQRQWDANGVLFEDTTFDGNACINPCGATNIGQPFMPFGLTQTYCPSAFGPDASASVSQGCQSVSVTSTLTSGGPGAIFLSNWTLTMSGPNLTEPCLDGCGSCREPMPDGDPSILGLERFVR